MLMLALVWEIRIFKGANAVEKYVQHATDNFKAAKYRILGNLFLQLAHFLG